MPDNHNQRLPQVIPLSEVATSLSVTPEFLYKEIQRGHLTAYKIGREFKIKREDLDAYLEKNKYDPSKEGEKNEAPE